LGRQWQPDSVGPTGSEPESAAETPENAAELGPREDSPDYLKALLEVLKAEKDEQFAAWQRSQADFANYRRRSEQERAELIKMAEAGLLRELLPVLDDLERAMGGLPAELRGLTWVEGILIIDRKLNAILEMHGLKPIEALGKEFDPFEHEAVIREGEPGEATTVTGELQKGYRFHDRVLRPTLVKVGKAAPSPSHTE
jgi:molecular chaperone GrpE